MTQISKLIIIGTLALSITSCASVSGHIDPDFGASVTAANDKQIISKQALTGAPVMDPQKKAAAYQRYLKDEVKKPKSQTAKK